MCSFLRIGFDGAQPDSLYNRVTSFSSLNLKKT